MSKKKIVVAILLGMAVGFINGFFGGGGGLIVVPMLIYAFKLDIKKAHATALLIILPMSIASSLTYIFSMQADLLISLYVAIGACIGGIVGSLLLKKLKGRVVEIIFTCVMLGAGIYMMF